MRYRTIVADPPWDYGADGGRWPVAGPTIKRKSIPYLAMTSVEISQYPVPDFADEDCRLFLWTTSRHLFEAFFVQRVWGFRYRQMIVWHKSSHSPFSGSVAPLDAEYLLVCVKGEPKTLGKLESSVVEAPRQRRHSQKPELFLDLIESVSPGPYLELFARRQRLGWDTWGNEALKHVELSA